MQADAVAEIFGKELHVNSVGLGQVSSPFDACLLAKKFQRRS